MPRFWRRGGAGVVSGRLRGLLRLRPQRDLQQEIKQQLEKICREAEANAGDSDTSEKIALAMICTGQKD